MAEEEAPAAGSTASATFHQRLVDELAAELAEISKEGVGRAPDRARHFLERWMEGDVEPAAALAGRLYAVDALHAVVRALLWVRRRVAWAPFGAARRLVAATAESEGLGRLREVLYPAAVVLVYLPAFLLSVALALPLTLVAVLASAALVLPLLPLCVLADRVAHGAPVFSFGLPATSTPTDTRLHRGELSALWAVTAAFGAAAGAVAAARGEDSGLPPDELPLWVGLLAAYAVNGNLLLGLSEMAADATTGRRPVSMWRVAADLADSARERRGTQNTPTLLGAVNAAISAASGAVLFAAVSLFLSGPALYSLFTTAGRADRALFLTGAGAAFLDASAAAAVAWSAARPGQSGLGELALVVLALFGALLLLMFAFYMEPAERPCPPTRHDTVDHLERRLAVRDARLFPGASEEPDGWCCV